MYDNLTEVNPNSLAVDTLFRPANWLMKITLINHLVLMNNTLITVFAPASGGKTSFIKLLQQGLDSTINAHVITATSAFNSASFLTQLGAIFSIESDSELTIPKVIEQINQQKKHCLVIVDDAEHLPQEFLQAMLLELNNYKSHNFFHICLVSDFSLKEKLSLESILPFAERIHSLELDALSENETKTYLLKNLYLTKGLNKTKLKQFYQLTGGNMASINAHMNNFFKDERFDIPKAKISNVKWLGLAASFLVVAMASAFLYESIDAAPSVAKYEIPSFQSPLISKIPALEVASFREAIKRPISDDKENEGEVRKMQAVRQCIVAISDAWSQENAAKPVIPTSSLVAIGPLVAKREQSVIAHQSIKSPVKKHKSTIVAKRINRVQRASSRHKGFTIQLLASRSQKVINQFLATHCVPQRAKVSISKREGVNWYVLTLGEYQYRNDAKIATKYLPENLVRLNPWIRSVDDLRAVG